MGNERAFVRTGPALLLVALVAGVALWLLGPDGDVDGAVEPQGSAESGPPAASVDEPEVTVPTTAGSAAPDAGEEATRREAPVPAQSAEPAKVVFDARVVVIEADGTERADADGELRFEHVVLARADAAFGQLFEGSIPIRAGRARWESSALVAGATLSSGRIEGRPARFEGTIPDLQAMLEAGVPVELRLRVEPEHRIEVLDAATGLPVPTATVLVDAAPSSFGPEALPIVLGWSRWIARDAPTPVALDDPLELSGGLQRLRVFVAATGYAWRYAELDLDRDRHVVELSPGGGLDVESTTLDAPFEAMLSLYRGDATQRAFEQVVEVPGRLALDHLGVGTWRVELRGGGEERRRFGLAAESVEVVAGERTALELAVAAPEEPEVAELDRTLVVELGAGWGLTRLEGMLTPLDAAAAGERRRLIDVTLEPAGDGLMGRTLIEQLRPGRYSLRLLDLGLGAELDFAREAEATVRIPGPAILTIECVDGPSGAAVDLPQLGVGAVDGEGGVAIFAPAERLGPGRFRATVIPGPVEVSVTASSLHPGHRQRFDVASGAAELRVALPRAQGVRITLRDDGEPLDFPGLLAPGLEAVDGEGRLTARARAGTALVCFASEPGRYRVRVGDLDGFEPVPPLEIDLLAGAIVELAVDLVRVD